MAWGAGQGEAIDPTAERAASTIEDMGGEAAAERVAGGAPVRRHRHRLGV